MIDRDLVVLNLVMSVVGLVGAVVLFLFGEFGRLYDPFAVLVCWVLFMLGVVANLLLSVLVFRWFGKG